jgi:nucleotide-binding universal stress UspA family protein
MFKKIVWATDGTAAAESALPLVKRLASDDSGTIVIAHVNELLAGRFGGQSLFADEPEIRARIDAEARELRDAGFDVDVQVQTSMAEHAADLIADIAESVDADVVVVGTPGHSAIGGLFAGSITQKLPRLLPCPLLIVPVHKTALV